MKSFVVTGKMMWVILVLCFAYFDFLAAASDFQTILPENPNDPLGLVGQTKKVLVIGGGVAGLSAGIELAQRGYNVTIKEKDDYVGGRVHSEKIHILGRFFNINHGFHAWFHNYFNFQDYLDELDVRENFQEWGAVDYRFPCYEDESIKSKSFFPANVMKIIRDSPNLSYKEVFKSPTFLKAATRDFCFYDFKRESISYDEMSAIEYASETEMPQDFFDIILFPALSATVNEPTSFSAAELLMYNQIYFLSNPRSDHRIVASKPYGPALFDSWKTRLEHLGVKFDLNKAVKALLLTQTLDGKLKIADSDLPNEKFDYAILACGLSGFKDIVKGSKENNLDSSVVEKFAAIESKIGSTQHLAPPYKIFRVWFDKSIGDSEPAILETPSYDRLNLIALCHRLEDESVEWAKETGGSVIEFHSYAWPEDEKDMSDEEAWETVKKTAVQILPELESLEPLVIHVNSYQNFPSFAKGTNISKPKPDTLVKEGLPNLYLAGDWIRTEFPAALMERAVLTGKRCANHILLKDSVRQVPLKVLPTKGPGLFKM